MPKITRRQVLKLGAGASTALVLSGCRTLLDRLNLIEPSPTTTTQPDPTAVLPTPTVTPSPLPPSPALSVAQSPIATPQTSPLEPSPTASPTPRPKPIAPAGGSRLGLHVVFGPRGGTDEFLWWCALSGQPVRVIKCVDDFEVAFKAKKYSDKTLTVGRVNAVGLDNKTFVDMQAWEPTEFSPPADVHYANAQEAAQQYYDLVKPTWKLNPVIDVWETFNEFSNHWAWQADFYIALMDLAEADGYRLGLWSPSAGNPPEDAYPDIARTCRRAREHGNHILCLHEYGLDGLLRDAPKNLVTRYRQLYQHLEQADAVIPLVLSEVGQNAGGGFTGVDVFLNDFAWYDRQMSKDSYVIGCAAWTLGDWSGANIEAALPALAEYIAGRPIPSRLHLPLIENAKVK